MSDETELNRGKVALRWWTVLQPSPDGARRGDPAALARLRRATTPVEAIGAAPEHVVRLARALDMMRCPEPAAEVAAVLAHVKTHDPSRKVAQALGTRSVKDAPPAMSELRFRRLLQAGTAEERMTAFRRAVRLLGGTVNVADLAESLLAWSHPDWGEQERIRWLFRYVGEIPPETEPDRETEMPEEEAVP